MKKYIASKGDFNVHFGFNEEGLLVAMQLPEDLTEASQLWLMRNLPICEDDLKHFGELSKMIITEAPTDLSFENFWNSYKNKVGNKKRAEKLWNALSNKDKMQALKDLPRYHSYMRTHPNLTMLYAETYLSQRRFDN